MYADTLRILASALLAMQSIGCALPQQKPSRTIPATEVSCKEAGGDWISLGIPYPGKPKSCDLKARDAGYQCSDSKVCEGVCLAPETAPAGARVTGKCSPYVRNFGNIHSVENGVVQDWNIE